MKKESSSSFTVDATRIGMEEMAQWIERIGTCQLVYFEAENSKGSALPSFTVKAWIGASPLQQDLWKGIHFQANWIPILWNDLVKNGVSEIRPLGIIGNSLDFRTTLRGILGADPKSWMTWIRLGPQSAPTGILVALTETSVKARLANGDQGAIAA